MVIPAKIASAKCIALFVFCFFVCLFIYLFTINYLICLFIKIKANLTVYMYLFIEIS